MDSFYVTLPSNASFDIYPNNTKSNFTTQFNTPIVLDGNYEVAIASITCTPNIKNDYGEIIIKNYIDMFPYLQHDNRLFPFIKNFSEFNIGLSEAKNIPDKIASELLVINFQ